MINKEQAIEELEGMLYYWKHIKFYNNVDELLLTRNIEGIQMRINAKTSVTGTFFQSDGVDAAITVANDWGEPINFDADSD